MTIRIREKSFAPAILSCAVLAIGLSAPQQDRLQVQSRFFPVAVWYGGGKARAPMLEPVTAESRRLWREDLLKIRELGFNTVRCWIEWTACEPRQGDFHFEQLELMLSLAEELDLRVLVQVYVDSAPDWVARKYPDSLFVAQNGAAIRSQSAPGYCFDHPGVRKGVLGFYQEAARRARKSKAFFGWDLWSEPHIINWAIIEYIPNATFCYCPNSIERFRRWLQSRYGSLDHLNAAWYRRFDDWKEVEPPRFGTILSYTDYIDWRVYVADKLAEDLRLRHEAIKQITPDRVTTSHAAVPSVFTNPAAGDGTPDDFLMNQVVDYWGTSFYPKHSFPSSHWSLARRTLAMDFTRSVSGDKGFYVGELQAGFGTRGVVVGEEITPADLELYTWGMVARGARAISYYAFYPMSSGYESGGYGLVGLDGALTERSRRAGDNARRIASNSDLILAARPAPAEAAVLYNRLSILVGGEQTSGNRAALRDSTAGYHRIFFERNIPLDFLSASVLTEEQLKKYKLVIVPYPILMTQQISDLLARYVEQGGRLFLEARAGWNDQRGYAQPVIPGFGWHKILGVREKSVTPRAESMIRWGEYSFLSSTMEERFEILSDAARAVASFEDGSPAAFERSYGRGRVIILGGFAGLANELKPAVRHPLGTFFAEWAGLKSPKLTASHFVELRELHAPLGRMVLFFNHDSQPVQADYTASLDKPAGKIKELIGGAEVTPSETKEQRLRTDLPANSVRVFRIDY
ncbi:MAG TPA: beta-galactosidase [Acidobacteriota bacterium]|jgi:beta-galactosidase